MSDASWMKWGWGSHLERAVPSKSHERSQPRRSESTLSPEREERSEANEEPEKALCALVVVNLVPGRIATEIPNMSKEWKKENYCCWSVAWICSSRWGGIFRWGQLSCTQRAICYCWVVKSWRLQRPGNVTWTINKTRIRPVAFPQRGLFPEFHAYGNHAEDACRMTSFVRSEGVQDVLDRRPKWAICEDQSHSYKERSEILRTVEISACRYCGCAMFEREREAVSCEVEEWSGCTASFRRGRSNTSLETSYTQQCFEQ